MKTIKPQSAGPGGNPGPGRRRYFVNIVTQSQILEFQGEVAAKGAVPLLAPAKRENRLLILAPNSETIDSFQKRALTQFQYNANVSADAVKLLEAHFCEVPRSYSIADALDAKSEAYLVVDNIKKLGPLPKRKATEAAAANTPGTSPPPESSPRTEPSAKRLRRREKQAVRLASPGISSAGESASVSQVPQLMLSSPDHQDSKFSETHSNNYDTSAIPHSAHKPLFGRSRAESERKLSTSLSEIPDTGAPTRQNNENAVEDTPATDGIASSHPTHTDPALEKATAHGPANEEATRGEPATSSSGAVSSQETPKRKRGRPRKSATLSAPAVKRATEAVMKPCVPETPKRNTASSRRGAEDAESSVGAQLQSTKLSAASTTSAVAQEVAAKEAETRLGSSAPPVKTNTEGDATSKNTKDVSSEANRVDNQASDSEASTDSGADDSDSSGSESDSGERQRRLSRRRVVAVPSGGTSNGVSSGASNGVTRSQGAEKPVSEPKPAPKPAPESASEPTAIKETPQLTPSSKPSSPNNDHTISRAEEPGSENTEIEKLTNAGGSRVPGLGSLADLANMRLPTVHEHTPRTVAPEAKKSADDESSEEEEDNNDSDDSNKSASSDSDSDNDASTAGRKGRRGGLLGLLRRK